MFAELPQIKGGNSYESLILLPARFGHSVVTPWALSPSPGRIGAGGRPASHRRGN